MNARAIDWSEPLWWRAMSDPYAPEPELEGLDAWRRAATGFLRRRAPVRRGLWRRAREIGAEGGALTGLRDEELDARLGAARDSARLGRAVCAAEWALVIEAAARSIGDRPYPVQIAGALALERGLAVEMATGEGKTLVIGLAAVVAGWRGRGCHVVTVNDYLAARDRDWMWPLHERCGIVTAALSQESGVRERRRAYAADVTYLTSKEAAADFLRDRLANPGGRTLGAELLGRLGASPPAARVQRGLACAIVDEADSVLLDEATTPLIISASREEDDTAGLVVAAGEIAETLRETADFRVLEQERSVRLTARGKEAVAAAGSVWSPGRVSPRRAEELVVEALTADRFFSEGEQYVIEDDEIVIVDGATGRRTPDRSWRHGFHQAIEAREGLPLTAPKDTLARVSFQRFFRQYQSLSGLSGTLIESAPELWSVYHLHTLRLPTHRRCRRVHERGVFVRTSAERDAAVVARVAHEHESGRPVLVGVRHVREAQRVSGLLSARGIEHRVLSATEHKSEAAVIARAGVARAVTVATNMAGRGTDIRLSDEARAAGGLCVIAVERQASPRIDRQLFGRAGRQGDPGLAVVFGSLQDELIRANTGRVARAVGRRVLGYSVLWKLAQRRSASRNLQNRRAVLRRDQWLDEALALGRARD